MYKTLTLKQVENMISEVHGLSGDVIRATRKELKISQGELAKAAKVHINTLSKIERGGGVTLKTVRQVLGALVKKLRR